MIDINDYKILFQRKDKRITKYWIIILIIIIIGIIYINNSFKYYEFYSNIGEYKNKTLNIYVLIDDLEKITKNEKIKIKNKEFAYNIKTISEENIYLNNNYYKEISLSIDKNNLIENEIAEIKIVTKESSLLEYIFKTVWR